MAHATATQPDKETPAKRFDRRRHSRVAVNVLGRFMLEDRREYPCQVINMSPGGAALIAPVQAKLGERVVAYLDHIGRIEGEVVREIQGGFAMRINAPLRKRDKLANVLTWLANRDSLNLEEDRRHERFTPKNPVTQIVLADGRSYRCRIVDVSLSGASLKAEVKPEIGMSIQLGKMRARVVRHFEDGIAVEFAHIQNRDLLEQHIS
ncbi:PilZ domain-containing protein [Stappia taiwanensis]|uniref:PilZ domain-containing protein n=1 Tax=Stappia taiwanensis TaxID=992267 RepID=A0A838XUN5_9HYPH|nr:PilZ domain-containing protein [Stappia taiwanensis]MBA4610570.1 PilZ domain-containing protein [Stappia taiwanensis]GGE83861.1 pilus assembly protein PilZ [Stappia taiwanensis]